MAKALKDLINGQKVSIDAHKTCVPFDWNHDDIHLHKKMNRGGNHAQMKIHLNRNNDIEFIHDRQDSKNSDVELVKEIKGVLDENKNKVDDLCRYLIKNLWNNADADNQQHLYEVIDHIAEQFDLSVNTSNEIKDQMYKVMKEFHPDYVNKAVYFVAITKGNKVVVGEKI